MVFWLEIFTSLFKSMRKLETPRNPNWWGTLFHCNNTVHWQTSKKLLELSYNLRPVCGVLDSPTKRWSFLRSFTNNPCIRRWILSMPVDVLRLNDLSQASSVQTPTAFCLLTSVFTSLSSMISAIFFILSWKSGCWLCLIERSSLLYQCSPVFIMFPELKHATTMPLLQ